MFSLFFFQYDGEGAVDVMLTPSQKNYYQTLKRLAARKPQKTVKRPKVSETKRSFSIIYILCQLFFFSFSIRLAL